MLHVSKQLECILCSCDNVSFVIEHSGEIGSPHMARCRCLDCGYLWNEYATHSGAGPWSCEKPVGRETNIDATRR
jgi:hypothetical protein